MHRSLPLAIGTSMLALLAASPAAKAATFQCDASALRVTVATAPAQEPITANRGAAACAPQEAGGALPATPLRGRRRRALRAHDVHRRRPALAGRRRRPPVWASCRSRCRCPPCPRSISRRCRAAACSPSRASGRVDIRPALAALIAPSGPLLALKGVTAEASASCQAGSPSVTGNSRLGELSVLGTKLSTTERGRSQPRARLAVDRPVGHRHLQGARAGRRPRRSCRRRCSRSSTRSQRRGPGARAARADHPRRAGPSPATSSPAARCRSRSSSAARRCSTRSSARRPSTPPASAAARSPPRRSGSVPRAPARRAG